MPTEPSSVPRSFPRSAARLRRESAALVLIDVQEKVAGAMVPQALDAVVKNLERWIAAAGLLDLPIAWTEQYPKGLGPTLTSLRQQLPAGLRPLEKLAFSCWGAAGFAEALQNKSQAIVIGMETHVCVFQTVRDLEEHGIETFVPIDAVISRAEDNRQAGLAAMRELGSHLTSTEMALFDAVQVAGTDEFRALSRLIR